MAFEEYKYDIPAAAVSTRKDNQLYTSR